MKTLKVFFVLFLILLEACNPAPTEPNVPPEPVVIVTIPFVEVTTTATTASIKSTVNTNGPTSIAVEYGVGNYGSSTDFIPSSFSTNTTANAKLTNLIPDTRYQFRIKAVTAGGTKHIADSTFITSSQLQIGDSYNDGLIDSLDNSGKHGSVIKQFPRSNWETAMKGNGKWILVNIDKLTKIYANRNLFNLTTIPRIAPKIK